jgi:hypothetical protein
MQQINRIHRSRVNLPIGHMTVSFFWQRRELCHWLFNERNEHQQTPWLSAIRTVASCSVPNFPHNSWLHSEGL